MEYQKIGMPDQELNEFYQNQKKYYELIDQVITPEYVQEDFETPEGFDEAHHFHLKIMDKGKMIAYLDLYDGYRHYCVHDPASVWIGLFLVDERVQRNHLGTMIIQRLCERMRGHERIQLACFVINQSGQRFWSHCGFKCIGMSEKGPYPMIIMEKRL